MTAGKGAVIPVLSKHVYTAIIIRVVLVSKVYLYRCVKTF